MCSSSPNTEGMNAAALANAQIGRDALKWYQQIYDEGRGDRSAASAAAREQSGLQTALAREALDTQRQERERYNTTFAPIEAKLASDAMAYDTPDRREAAAGQAMADVGSQFALSGASAARDAASRGVDPSSPSFAISLARQAISEAAAKAAAGNTARQNVEAIGAAKMMDAAGLGRGVVSNQATQAQIGLNSGNSAVANANVPNTVNMQGAQLGGQGFSTAIGANNSSGQMYGQIAGLQAGVDQQNSNAQMAGASTIALGAIAI